VANAIVGRKTGGAAEAIVSSDEGVRLTV
jgi:hypothetical protein